MTIVHFGFFHGVKTELEPITYRDRNQITVIACGTESKYTYLDPIVVYLRHYSAFYEDFVDKFVEFYFKYLGANYMITYRENGIPNDGYNLLFKYMMRLHRQFRVTHPDSQLQIFRGNDRISNLSLTTYSGTMVGIPELVDSFYSVLPPYKSTTQSQTLMRRITPQNFGSDYFSSSFVSDNKVIARFNRQVQESWTSPITGLVQFHEMYMFGLYDRLRTLVPTDTSMTLERLCAKYMPSRSILVLTACRVLHETMRTQIYRGVPSLQQVIDRLKQLKVEQAAKKRTRASQQQQQQPHKKRLRP